LARLAYLLMPNQQTADTLGWILTTQGSQQTGLMLLRQAASFGATDPNIVYHLAVALQKNGQSAEAVKLLVPLVSGTAEFAEKAEARHLLTELSKG
jgi:cellulose synthase operon protein C